MNIIDKLKKNPRTKYVVIAMVLLLIWGNMGEVKKEAQSQSVCDAYNTGGYILTKSQYTSCNAADCTPQYNYNPNDWGIIGDFINFADWLAGQVGLKTDFASCKSSAADGTYILSSSESEARDSCNSRKASLVKNKWFGDDIYVCQTGDPDDACKNVNEEKIAEIFLYPDYIEDCGTAYAVTIFGGGFLALLGIFAVI